MPSPGPIDTYWSDVSVQVLGTVIGAIIVGILGLIATIVKRTWREKIWGWVGKLAVRIRSVGLRVTTAKSRKVETDAEVTKALDAFKGSIGPNVADLAVKLSEAKEGATQVAKDAYVSGVTKGRDDLEAEIRKRNEFVPTPRWAVSKAPMGHFLFKNSTKDSIARVVRLDADSKLFTFFSGAQWANMDGPRTAGFEGRATAVGAYQGIMFTVTYTDAGGTRQVEEAFLDGWEPGVY